MKLTIPAFGEQRFSDHRENAASRVVLMENADSGAFDAYASLLEENGYRRMEAYAQGGHRFAAYFDGERGMFLNEYAAIGRLTIVEEEPCCYFAYEDVCAKASVPAQITQVSLEDFGMSYVIRLTDGRFIVLTAAASLSRIGSGCIAASRTARWGKSPSSPRGSSRIRTRITSTA